MHFADHFGAVQLALNEHQVKVQLGSNHAFNYIDKDGKRRCDMGTTCILHPATCIVHACPATMDSSTCSTHP
jgi:hypothetical protein